MSLRLEVKQKLQEPTPTSCGFFLVGLGISVGFIWVFYGSIEWIFHGNTIGFDGFLMDLMEISYKKGQCNGRLMGMYLVSMGLQCLQWGYHGLSREYH